MVIYLHACSVVKIVRNVRVKVSATCRGGGRGERDKDDRKTTEIYEKDGQCSIFLRVLFSCYSIRHVRADETIVRRAELYGPAFLATDASCRYFSPTKRK